MKRTPTPYTVFSDESATDPRERYLGVGAILLPTDRVEAAEAHLDALCIHHGLQGEISWKDCRENLRERYCIVAQQLWLLHKRGVPIDFRCMLVDTERNPLIAPKFGCRTKEEGFYKLYHQFLRRSVSETAPHASEVSLLVANLSDQYPYRTQILDTTLKGGWKHDLGDSFRRLETRRTSPRQSRIHQMADLLVGAVCFDLNQRISAGPKQHLRDYIAKLAGRPLNEDFLPHERPFNIWSFGSKGQSRWARGSVSSRV